jgi:hypothetical protein
VTLPFLFWRVSLAALSSCDPGEAGVNRGGPVGEQLMLNGGWSSPATHRKNNAAALRLVFLYLLHMDNVPQRQGQNLLPVNLTIFSSAKICKICPRLTPIQLTGGAALSGRELVKVAGETQPKLHRGSPGLQKGNYVGGAWCQDWTSTLQLETMLT